MTRSCCDTIPACAARQHRWEELTSKFERQFRMQGRTLLQQSDKSLPHPSTEEISAALQKTKPATAPGYNIHVEFLKYLGPKARTWLSKFFSRIMATHFIPKIWRKAKVIAIEKPGKDPSLAANYRPISLLSVCYKFLERLALQRISPTVEGLLSPDQAGFRKGRSTCDHVAALTTFIKNGFRQNLKTGAVFLDLTAAYDTVWHTGLLYKLSINMPYWFTRLVGLLCSKKTLTSCSSSSLTVNCLRCHDHQQQQQ